jgi:hypothetical protein
MTKPEELKAAAARDAAADAAYGAVTCADAYDAYGAEVVALAAEIAYDVVYAAFGAAWAAYHDELEKSKENSDD